MTERSYLPLFTLFHFTVDLSCIYCMNAIIPPRTGNGGEMLFFVILYNLLAFALPMLLGIAADIIRKDRIFASSGCLLISLALFTGHHPLPTVLLVGTGNGLFHIGAGREVLIRQGSHMSPSGIFISSGALGVFFGRYWGRSGYSMRYAFFILPLICAVILMISAIRQGRMAPASEEAETDVFSGLKLPLFCAVPVFAVVFIRSYYGTLLTYDWKDSFFAGLIFTFCIVLGKLLGGIAADIAGAPAASLISLLIAGITALLSFRMPFFGCVSVLFFNMTMPVTLSLMAGCMPSLPGLAFGTLMFALFLGTLPSMAWRVDTGASPAGLMILCLVSALILSAVFVGSRRKTVA